MQYITQDNYLCIEGVVIKEGRPAGGAAGHLHPSEDLQDQRERVLL